MGLEYVDIFYSHRFDPETPLEETMGALASAVRSGKALYVGISNYDPEQTIRAKQILDSIIPYQESKLFQDQVKKTGVVVDVGFGGGFPILPLAKLLPDVTFIGVESKRKKVGLSEVILLSFV
jgi:hypothetical protein